LYVFDLLFANLSGSGRVYRSFLGISSAKYFYRMDTDLR